MFYRVEVLSRKGKLASAWVAAHFEKRLSKNDIKHTSIEKIIKEIEEGKVPTLALRTSSHILLGLSRILFRKTKILYEECSSLFQHWVKGEKKRIDGPKEAEKERITKEIRIEEYLPILEELIKNEEKMENNEEVYGEKDGEIGSSFYHQDVEYPRSRFSLSSGFDHSFTLNDISLSVAETAHSCTSEGIVMNQASTTLNTIGDLAEKKECTEDMLHEELFTAIEVSMHTPIEESMEKPVPITNEESICINRESVDTRANIRKNMQEAKEQRKRVKIDKQLSIPMSMLNLVSYIHTSYQSAEREKLPLNIPWNFLLEDQISSFNREKKLSIEVPRRTSLEEYPQSLPFIYPEQDPFMEQEEIHIKKDKSESITEELLNPQNDPQNTSLHSISLEHLPDHEDKEDTSFNTSFLLQEMKQIDISTEEYIHPKEFTILSSADKKEKISAFFLMLKRVSDGNLIAKQSHGYAPIIIQSIA
ncbi:hypothetical protein NEFER03_1778 [Nematocida sp. LUAm3]|nr:hypothetical protein NEFER03_1778 [Nematocida sp. LUAm3]KAI5173915.1 hypothetical protein NEFER02_0382 [Nematocida sp. LUAm2]KAI5177340.1 hypothetical protein NEFER01_0615 [Nematocida sp. LUAm1]